MTRRTDMKPITDAEFLAELDGEDVEGKSRLARALETSLDNRKFEIDLYWRRAAYFWTFIGAAFVAFGAISNNGIQTVASYEMRELLAGFGLSLSAAWWYVNKGSRFWQVHWERMVDLLEDKLQGPLYKTIFISKIEEARIFGARGYSVSKINQVVVLNVVLVWILLLLNSAIHLSPALTEFMASSRHTYLWRNLGAGLGLLPPLIFYWAIRHRGRSRYWSAHCLKETGLIRRA